MLIILFSSFLLLTYPGLLFINRPIQSTSQYTPGPTHVQVDADENGNLYVVWEEFFEEPDATVFSVIKLRSYINSSWSPETIILPHHVPNSYEYVTYSEYATSPTSITCNDFGEIAVGWLNLGGSSLYRFAGPAFYRLYNGTHWSAIHQFTNCSDIAMFRLKYSKYGVLYAVWKQIEEENWQVYTRPIGSPDQPIPLLRSNETDTLISAGHPLELLPLSNGRLHYLWGYHSLHHRSYFNGTFSEIQNISTNIGTWKVTIDSAERIHLAWSQYTDWPQNLQNVTYCSLFNNTWEFPTLITDLGFLIDCDTDSTGNVQILWGQPDPSQHNLNGQAFSTIKPNGSTWDTPKPINIPSILSQLAMINTTHSHIFSIQHLNFFGFLIHGNNIYYTIVPTRQLFHHHAVTTAIISTKLIGSAAPIYFQRQLQMDQIRLLLLFIGVLVFIPLIIGALHRLKQNKKLTKPH